MLIRLLIIFLSTLICSPTYGSEQSEIKKYSIKIIEKGLYSSNEDVRIESLMLIGKNKLVDSSIKKQIFDILRYSQSDYEKAASIYCLSNVKDTSTTVLFKQIVDEKKANSNLSRIAAAVALYNLGERNALAVIETYLNSGDTGEAIEAARSAGQLKDGNAISLLRATLNKKNEMLKIAVLESLARLGDKISDDEINSLLNNNAIWPALKIIKITGNKKYKQEVEKAINSNNPLIRLEASVVLSKIGGTNSKPIVQEYLLSKQDKYGEYSGEDVRLFALDALSEIGDTSELPLLRKYLDSQNEKERVAAAGSILAILIRATT